MDKVTETILEAVSIQLTNLKEYQKQKGAAPEVMASTDDAIVAVEHALETGHYFPGPEGEIHELKMQVLRLQVGASGVIDACNQMCGGTVNDILMINAARGRGWVDVAEELEKAYHG